MHRGASPDSTTNPFGPSLKKDSYRVYHGQVFDVDPLAFPGGAPRFHMSVFVEFGVPASEFALHDTLTTLPDAIVEIERVAASEDILTPYFWVANTSPDEFENAAKEDPSVQHLRELDSFDDATLYRAEWTQRVGSIVYAYTEIGDVILDATSQGDKWRVEMRFDTREDLQEFRGYCEDSGLSYTVIRLHELSQSHTGSQYGLSPKQHEALVTVWQAGYYDTPSKTTLQDAAADIGISQQALSERLRNAYDLLIANTLITTAPD